MQILYMNSLTVTYDAIISITREEWPTPQVRLQVQGMQHDVVLASPCRDEIQEFLERHRPDATVDAST